DIRLTRNVERASPTTASIAHLGGGTRRCAAAAHPTNAPVSGEIARPRAYTPAMPQRPPSAAMPAPTWLPRFCNGPTLFAVVIVAELVALVIVLVPDGVPQPWLRRLAVVTVYVQWLALLNVVVLCSLRGMLDRVGLAGGFVLAWCASVLVTALGALVICRLDQALSL